MTKPNDRVTTVHQSQTSVDIRSGATVYTIHSSPIGDLLLVGEGSILTGLYMFPHRHGPSIDPAWIYDPIPFRDAIRQLSAYFSGELIAFDLPLELRGSPFQLEVWQALRTIPYGETISYGQLAAQVGNPKAARAVGLANGRNPISVIVPCHRVIGSSGTLTGYGGGLDRKRWLLAHEAVHAQTDGLFDPDLTGTH